MIRKTDLTELRVYNAVCTHDGLRAAQIAKLIDTDRTTVNRHLYSSPLLHELCWQDNDSRWHGLIRQERPHSGLGEYAGWYGTADDFLRQDEGEWLARLQDGCVNIGRNLNDTRGLIHSFKDCRAVMRRLFSDLALFLPPERFAGWELCFEFRLKKSRHIRIYADVLLVTEERVFSLEFKMKDDPDPAEVSQAAKYIPFLDVIFGPRYEVIPVLVLTAAADRFGFEPLADSGGAEVAVCSGDMLFNALDCYMGFIDAQA